MQVMMKQLLRDKLVSVSRRVPAFRGKMRLTRALQRALGPRAPVTTECLGAKFLVEGHDIIEFSLLWRGAYGKPVVDALQREITERRRSCFWDIGANIGSVCLPLAVRNPQLAVHAFEPSPRAQARLGANRMANPGVSNVNLYSLALSNDEVLTPFFESYTHHSSGISTMYAETHNTDIGAVLVQSIRGDTLIANGTAPRPDLIKIDVEGWEHEALEGLSDLIGGRAPLSILWEHCLYRIEERGQPKDVIVRMLESAGFELFSCQEAGPPAPFTPGMLDRDSDFLARRD